MQAQLANHALVEPFLRFWTNVVVDGLSFVLYALSYSMVEYYSK